MATDADKLGATVVLDYGSDTLKAGRARDLPAEHSLSCVTRSLVEVSHGGEGAAAAAAASGDGAAAAELPTRAAVERGRMVDADAFEALLHHVLYDRMRWRPGREDCLVVVEPVLASRAEREAIARIAFEAMHVRGLFFADAAACAMFACNKQAGLVVDIGHGKGLVTAVFEGVAHVAGSARTAWAGADLDAYVPGALAAAAAAAAGSSRGSGGGGGGSGGGSGAAVAAAAAAAAKLTPQQLRALKESAAAAAASAEDYAALMAGDTAAAARAEAASATAAAEKAQLAAGAQRYEDEWRAARGRFALPDGTALDLGRAGYVLGEAIVRPSSAGVAAPTLAELCADAVAAHGDPAARRAAWEAVLVTGGVGGSMPGLRERVLAELPLAGPLSAPYAAAPLPNYLPPDARRHAAWMGGAVLARVAMHQMLTANEYDEFGPAAVGRIA